MYILFLNLHDVYLAPKTSGFENIIFKISFDRTLATSGHDLGGFVRQADVT
jgi:hypothetical protein